MPECAPRSLLALDFDGVICNSLREVFAVAQTAYAELNPASPLIDRLAAVSFADPPDPLYDRFRDLVPLGNRAEDFGVALTALDRAVNLPDQQRYDRFKASLPASFLDDYHHCFYRHRTSLRRRDLGAWLGLHTAYDAFVDVLRDHPPTVTLAIATAKDHASVRLLIDHFGIGELFPDGMILDKETAPSKTVHLELLGRRSRIPPHRISFVDDKLNHLVSVAPLGVRPILAGWGYNTNREREAAAAQGFAVATLDNARTVVFPHPSKG